MSLVVGFQTISFGFSPWRGEQNPLMWGCLPPDVGKIRFGEKRDTSSVIERPNDRFGLNDNVFLALEK